MMKIEECVPRGKYIVHRKRISAETREQIAADYAAGMYVYDIAQKYGVSPTSVCRIARGNGMRMHGRGYRRMTEA